MHPDYIEEMEYRINAEADFIAILREEHKDHGLEDEARCQREADSISWQDEMEARGGPLYCWGALSYHDIPY